MAEEYNNMDVLDIQKETVETLREYLPRLQKGIGEVITELKGERKEDTDEYLRMNIDGLNWVIEAYNGTVSLVDPEKTKVKVDSLEEGIAALGKSYGAKEDDKIAENLENVILPFLSQLLAAVSE